ncbi:IFITM10 isoform 2 [Pongo abelii]|uniref:IFITM10 isoform 2 n=1 Tax=Pongo abelii TaxID=9601 RepID=A0A2J8S6Q9_PONAB|nr:IFITM10 isoform 2 [Pongo abelii]
MREGKRGPPCILSFWGTLERVGAQWELEVGPLGGGSVDRQRPAGRRKDARTEAQGVRPRTEESLAGPGPQPVPSPAGSPGQHHGRRPGSPSPPGRGLLDPEAPGRFAQGLLRLRVQAPCPAGSSGPCP